jgi:hypothetical protein
MRTRLLELPQHGFPPSGQMSELIQPPDICSVAREQSVGAELFWCYGFHGDRRDLPEAACVLLIALCAEEPDFSRIEAWRRELAAELLLLPGGVFHGSASGSRGDLWLVLPAPSLAALDAAGPERRFSVEAFAGWLKADEKKKL